MAQREVDLSDERWDSWERWHPRGRLQRSRSKEADSNGFRYTIHSRRFCQDRGLRLGGRRSFKWSLAPRRNLNWDKLLPSPGVADLTPTLVEGRPGEQHGFPVFGT